MNKYLMLFCRSDPASYMGHRIHSIKAPNMEEAEKIGHDWLEERNHLTIGRFDKFEYRIVQVVEGTGARVYSTKQHKRL